MDTNPITPTPNTFPDAGKPKHYIRTFTGDMETLKKGGTPDLAPLRRTAEPSEQSIEPSLPTPAAPLPAQPLPAAPAPQQITEPFPSVVPKGPASVPLKTYAGDFSDRMKETHSSTATVLAAEQDSASLVPQAQPEKISRSNLLYSIVGGVLLIAGIVGVYLAYTRYLTVSSPITIAPTVAAPIFVDEREKVSGSGSALLQSIAQLVVRPLASGTVRLLYLDTSTATSSVFSSLQLPAPGVLLRNIVAPKSMAGVVSADGNQSPFFILSVASFGDTFAGMLSWEPRMPRDLSKLFLPYPVSVTATTTSKDAVKTPLVSSAAFFDATIANHDVRVYRDSEGRDVLLYGYWNQTTLVIARDAAAFTEIVGRLATSRTQL